MRRGRILILFALILLFGVVAVWLLMRGRAGGGGGETTAATPMAPQDTTYIVIALQDISRGSLIPADGVGLSPFPRDMVVETMIENDLNQVVGQHARQDIPRGAPVTTGMITERTGDLLGTGSDAAIAIPPGYTAISVPMNRLSGVAFAIRPGDSVDVIVTMTMVDIDPDFQTLLPNDTLVLVGSDGTLLTALACQEFKMGERGPECTNPEAPPLGRVDTEEQTNQVLYVMPTEPQRPRLVSQRLISNATVLQVGSFATIEEENAPEVVVQTEPAAETGTTGQATTQEAAAPRPPDIITLIVTPQEALALNYAIRTGADLTFTLRAPEDSSPTETVSVTLQYLVQNYNITVPTRLPYGPAQRLEEPIEPVLPNDTPPVATQ
jgi:Flp pilus assembly protein CpaB